MAEPTLSNEELMAMLAALEGGPEGFAEEEGGGGMATLLGLGGAGAYVGVDPYRRSLLAQLVGGPDRRKLAGAIGTGVKERFTQKPAWNPLWGRKAKIGAGREATLIAAGAPEKLLEAASKSKFGPGYLGKAAKGGAKGLLRGAGLSTPLGWAMALWLAYDLAKAGWGAAVEKPREEELRLSETLQGVFQEGREGRESLLEAESLADQLEGLGRGQSMNQPMISTELQDILRAHDLSSLYRAAQPTPRPSFEQAMAMVGGL
jgi:hypothetical protein